MQQRAGTPLYRGRRSPFPGWRSQETILYKQQIPQYHRGNDSEVGYEDELDAFDVFMSSLPRGFYPTKTTEIATFGKPHLLRLPLKVRFGIYDFITESERAKYKKVVLSPVNTVTDFWPDDHFIEPSNVFYFIGDLSETCFQLRHEILSYYCSQFHFHITYNYFCTPFAAPIIHKWLPLFANRIQYLTIEADFTILGGSYKNGAFPLPDGHEEIMRFMESLARKLTDRAGPIQSLHVMCRRYKGYRPSSQHNMTGYMAPTKYCPAPRTHILDYFLAYCGSTDTPVFHFRLSGFPGKYSNDILTTMSISNFRSLQIIRAPKCSPWPLDHRILDTESSTTDESSMDETTQSVTSYGSSSTIRQSFDIMRSNINSPLSTFYEPLSLDGSLVEPTPPNADFDNHTPLSDGVGLGIEIPRPQNKYTLLGEFEVAEAIDKELLVPDTIDKEFVEPDETEAITDVIREIDTMETAFDTLYGDPDIETDNMDEIHALIGKSLGLGQHSIANSEYDSGDDEFEM